MGDFTSSLDSFGLPRHPTGTPIYQIYNDLIPFAKEIGLQHIFSLMLVRSFSGELKKKFMQ